MRERRLGGVNALIAQTLSRFGRIQGKKALVLQALTVHGIRIRTRVLSSKDLSHPIHSGRTVSVWVTVALGYPQFELINGSPNYADSTVRSQLNQDPGEIPPHLPSSIVQ